MVVEQDWAEIVIPAQNQEYWLYINDAKELGEYIGSIVDNQNKAKTNSEKSANKFVEKDLQWESIVS